MNRADVQAWVEEGDPPGSWQASYQPAAEGRCRAFTEYYMLEEPS